jgi:hypothetical protein
MFLFTAIKWALRIIHHGGDASTMFGALIAPGQPVWPGRF